uniref:Endoplasmic reticulum lectin 1 n=1 Tax=Molossus molossus TaxID=27622 RepID=A0A7J8E1A6_MOLMO|nr:endoplasmic reticulum lectin 1 [Molossus molossus]
MEEGGGGARSLVPGGPVLLVLCGLLEASGGGRALPQLSDDIPFRVNWPGTEFSLPTTGVLYKEDNYVIMTTTHKEKYKCILPLVTGGDEVCFYKYIDNPCHQRYLCKTLQLHTLK